MPRFALLLHRTPAGYQRPTHFDLLLEAGNTCRTWALADQPHAQQVVVAECLAEHRLLYLDYEGEISGGRGSVSQFDSGQFEWLLDTQREVQIRLEGKRLRGSLVLKQNHQATKVWDCWYTPTG